MENYQMSELSFNELEIIEGGLIVTAVAVVCTLIVGFAAGYQFASK